MNIKRMNRLIFSCLVALSAFFGPLHADVDILFETSTQTAGLPEVSVSNESMRGNLHLVTGKDFFQIGENSLEYIYDFSKRKVFVLDTKNKTYEVYSVYTYLGFRTAEFENRLLVYENFKNKKDMRHLEPVMLEHYFSLKSSRDPEKITIVSDNEKITYKTAGSTLMETAKTGKTISKNDLSVFLKFMRYRIGGHPEILSKISEGSTIPDWIAINTFDDRSVKKSYRIAGFKNISENTYSLEGYKTGGALFTGEFVNFVNTAALNAEKNAAGQMASIETQIKDAAERKNYLEAMLGCMEIGLYNSHFDTPVCKSELQKFQGDDKVKILLNNLNGSEKNPFEKSYLKLKELEPASLKKNYVLWVFEANLKARSGNPEEAFNLYYNALKVNPWLTGAYKDIGEIFYNKYRMDLAWLCWDAGRKIFSSHSMLKEIDKLEEGFVKKYPEFF